jgi:hypothetical protein
MGSPHHCPPKGQEEAPSPRRGFFIFLAEPFALHWLFAYSVDDVTEPLDTTNESALIGGTRVEGWGQGRFLCQAGAALFYS